MTVNGCGFWNKRGSNAVAGSLPPRSVREELAHTASALSRLQPERTPTLEMAWAPVKANRRAHGLFVLHKYLWPQTQTITLEVRRTDNRELRKQSESQGRG